MFLLLYVHCTLSCLITLRANRRAPLGQEDTGSHGCGAAVCLGHSKRIRSSSILMVSKTSRQSVLFRLRRRQGWGRGGRVGCSCHSWGRYCHTEIGVLRARLFYLLQQRLLLDVLFLLGLLQLLKHKPRARGNSGMKKRQFPTKRSRQWTMVLQRVTPLPISSKSKLACIRNTQNFQYLRWSIWYHSSLIHHCHLPVE